MKKDAFQCIFEYAVPKHKHKFYLLEFLEKAFEKQKLTSRTGAVGESPALVVSDRSGSK